MASQKGRWAVKTRRKLTKMMTIKCEPKLVARIERAAWLTGLNVSAFVRATMVEKILQLSVDYPQLKEGGGRLGVSSPTSQE